MVGVSDDASSSSIVVGVKDVLIKEENDELLINLFNMIITM